MSKNGKVKIMNKCNKCYWQPHKNEGCFTRNVVKFLKAKYSPCLDGTWKTITPLFVKVKGGKL